MDLKYFLKTGNNWASMIYNFNMPVTYIMLYTRKHGYGKMGAISVLGTSWVRILPGYRCMHPPGVPVFAQKKFSQYVSGRIQYKLGTDGTKTKSNGVVSTRFLLLSYSILTLKQSHSILSLMQSHSILSLTSSLYRWRAMEGAPIVDLQQRKVLWFWFLFWIWKTRQKKGIGVGRDKKVKKSKVMSGCYKKCIIF